MPVLVVSSWTSFFLPFFSFLLLLFFSFLLFSPIVCAESNSCGETRPARLLDKMLLGDTTRTRRTTKLPVSDETDATTRQQKR